MNLNDIVVNEGWLHKEETQSPAAQNSWKKRWFLLKGSMLYQFPKPHLHKITTTFCSPTSESAEWFIDLSNCIDIISPSETFVPYSKSTSSPPSSLTISHVTNSTTSNKNHTTSFTQNVNSNGDTFLNDGSTKSGIAAENDMNGKGHTARTEHHKFSKRENYFKNGFQLIATKKSVRHSIFGSLSMRRKSEQQKWVAFRFYTDTEEQQGEWIVTIRYIIHYLQKLKTPSCSYSFFLSSSSSSSGDVSHQAKEIQSLQYPNSPRSTTQNNNNNNTTMMNDIYFSEIMSRVYGEKTYKKISEVKLLQWYQSFYDKLLKQFEVLKRQEDQLTMALETSKKLVEEQGMEWFSGESVQLKIDKNYQTKHLLIEFLLLLTQKQIYVCKLLRKFSLTRAMDDVKKISTKSTLPKFKDHKEFMDAIQNEFLQQENVQSYLEELQSLHNETDKLSAELSEKTVTNFSMLIQHCKTKTADLQQQRSEIMKQLISLQEEEHETENITAEESPTFVPVPNSNNLPKELLEVHIQLLEKQISLLNFKQDAYKDKERLFKDFHPTSKNELHMAILPVKQKIHFLYLPEQQMHVCTELEMQQSDLIFTLSVMLQKLKVHKYFLVQRNIKQLKAKCTYLSATLMKELKLILTEQEAYQSQKKAVENMNEELSKPDEFQTNLVQMKLDLVQSEIALNSRKLEMIEQYLSEIRIKEIEHKSSHDDILFYPMYELLDIDVNYDEEYFRVSCDKLFEKFTEKLNKEEELGELSDKIEKIREELTTIEIETKTSIFNSSKMRATKANRKSVIKETLLYMLMNLSETVAYQEITKFIEKVQENKETQDFGLLKSSPSMDSISSFDEGNLYCLQNMQSFIRYLSDLTESSRKDLSSFLDPKEMYEAIEYTLFLKNDCILYKLCLERVQVREQDGLFLNLCKKWSSLLIANILHEDNSSTTDEVGNHSTNPVSKDIMLKWKQEFEMQHKESIDMIHYLSSAKKTPSPSIKLGLITQTSKTIMETIGRLMKEKSQKSTEIVATEDFLPVLICVVAVAGVQDMISQLNFIKAFGNEELLNCSEHAFYLCSLESAVFYINDYNTSNIEQLSNKEPPSKEV